LLILIWLVIILQVSGACTTLFNAVRYRDVMVHLDIDRIAYQPFQPKISLIVRCNPRSYREPVRQIRQALSLNYSQYELILIIDSRLKECAFGEIIRSFSLIPQSFPEKLHELDHPVRQYYRSTSHKRLIVIDKAFHPDDDLRYTGAAVCKADYMLFVRSLDNELLRNSLANLAVMKMRNGQEHISSIRGVGRYACEGPVAGNFFRLLAEVCNLRRIYVMGMLRQNDFGQFVTLEDISGKEGLEEVVPQPQMVLHRKNAFRTYWFQLAPRIRYKNWAGTFVSVMELLMGLFLWGAVMRTAAVPGNPDNLLFILTALLLPLQASAFSILVAEVFLRREVRIKFVFRLVCFSFLETILFCIFQPVVWLTGRFVRGRDS